MKPLDVQQIGQELAIKWDDGSETFLSMETLRRACPCATCKGEMDVLGNLAKGPDVPLTPRSFELRRIGYVGGYGLQPVWADGHSTGIFSYDYLKRLGELASER